MVLYKCVTVVDSLQCSQAPVPLSNLRLCQVRRLYDDIMKVRQK